MFGWTRRSENLLANYRALIADQREEIRELREQLRSAHDKIMALTAPASLREARRGPSPAPQPVRASGNARKLAAHVGRTHWPADLPNLRPPSPKAPPGRAELSDNQAAAAGKRMREEDE